MTLSLVRLARVVSVFCALMTGLLTVGLCDANDVQDRKVSPPARLGTVVRYDSGRRLLHLNSRGTAWQASVDEYTQIVFAGKPAHVSDLRRGDSLVVTGWPGDVALTISDRQSYAAFVRYDHFTGSVVAVDRQHDSITLRCRFTRTLANAGAGGVQAVETFNLVKSSKCWVRGHYMSHRDALAGLAPGYIVDVTVRRADYSAFNGKYKFPVYELFDTQDWHSAAEYDLRAHSLPVRRAVIENAAGRSAAANE